jgi:hypothetical protein
VHWLEHRLQQEMVFRLLLLLHYKHKLELLEEWKEFG